MISPEMPAAPDRARTLARIVLVFATMAIASGYASAFLIPAPEWGPWMLAVGIPAAVTAIMTLGAARRSRGIGPLVIPFVFVFVLLAGGFCLALLLPSGNPGGERLLLGLPLRAAIVIYGVGLTPVVILPIAYALTFATQTLNEADIQRVRDVARRMRDTKDRS